MSPPTIGWKFSQCLAVFQTLVAMAIENTSSRVPWLLWAFFLPPCKVDWKKTRSWWSLRYCRRPNTNLRFCKGSSVASHSATFQNTKPCRPWCLVSFLLSFVLSFKSAPGCCYHVMYFAGLTMFNASLLHYLPWGAGHVVGVLTPRANPSTKSQNWFKGSSRNVVY